MSILNNLLLKSSTSFSCACRHLNTSSIGSSRDLVTIEVIAISYHRTVGADILKTVYLHHDLKIIEVIKPTTRSGPDLIH